jgi:hypothetical protein
MCTSSWSSFTPSIDDSLCWHPELETNREAVCIIQHFVELITPSRTVRTIRTVRTHYGNWQIRYGNRTDRPTYQNWRELEHIKDCHSVWYQHARMETTHRFIV